MPGAGAECGEQWQLWKVAEMARCVMLISLVLHVDW
jgi:hypothetical protein